MSEAIQDRIEEQSIPTTVAEALDLELVEPNLYRAPPASADDPRSLYGGYLASIALRAGLNTTPEGRSVHSMHGYFLRPGDATSPILLRVERDRDGGQYSARRVIATQRGAVIFSMAASFQDPQPGPEFQSPAMPTAEDPSDLPGFDLDPRMLDLDCRVPTDPESFHRWPTRLWVRVREELPADPNAHACALTFISDMCTGLSKAPEVKRVGILPSLDHAIWIHRAANLNDWVLMDLVPESTGSGRGLYTGRIFDRQGNLLASLSQESLFRIRPESQRIPG